MTDRDLYVRNIDNYFLSFQVGGTTTYTIQNSDGQTVEGPSEYTSGDPIEFKGIKMTLSSTGTIANNDVFQISPTPRESIFTTIQSMITNLRTSTSSQEAQDSVNQENQNLLYQINALINHVSSVTAVVGSRQNSIERAQELNEEVILSAKSVISELEDTDMISAISKLNAYTISLQAAQQSFIKIQGLSLFNFI